MSARPHARELVDARQRVERVAPQEVLGPLDGTAVAPVLVAPVLPTLRLLREVEVEVRRAPGGACGARQDHAEHVCVLVVVHDRAEEEELFGSARCEPGLDVTGRTLGRAAVEAFEPPQGVSDVALQREEVVRARLDVHQQAVEGRDVDPGRPAAALERLDERRAGAGEGIEHRPRPRQVARQERLHELGHELAEVRVQPVDVLRPLALGEVALRPGEVEVDVAVERFLRRGHLGPVSTRALERLSQMLDAAGANADDVEPRLALSVLGMRGEPGLGSLGQTTLLLGRDHLQRVAEPSPALRLHLAEDDRSPAAQDEVELVAADPLVRRQHAIAAQPEAPLRAPLGLRAPTPRAWRLPLPH